MSFSVMMLPPEGTTWHIDADTFVAAARQRFPYAEVNGPIPFRGNQMVMVTVGPDNGRQMLSATLKVEEDHDGAFSIKSGTGPEAAEMFSWFRTWLGPDQRAAILTTSGGATLAEIPAGADSAAVERIVDSLMA